MIDIKKLIRETIKLQEEIRQSKAKSVLLPSDFVLDVLTINLKFLKLVEDGSLAKIENGLMSKMEDKALARLIRAASKSDEGMEN